MNTSVAVPFHSDVLTNESQAPQTPEVGNDAKDAVRLGRTSVRPDASDVDVGPMNDSDLLVRYNYDEFIPEKFGPWLNFSASPPLGQLAPDYPLWDLDGAETRLSTIWARHTYTIVEFGSFT